MKSKTVDIKRVAPGMVKIESKIEDVLTLDRYLEMARDLLINGLDPSIEKLKDVGSPEVVENMLLYQEMDAEKKSDVQEVAFRFRGKDYIVNLKNIDRIYCEKPEFDSYAETIRESLEELFR